MPSVCGKGVSSEGAPEVGPLGAALQIVDKKVRNLEKRKSKLDGYRADFSKGKELNEDQKVAITKYDEVVQTLDFARELSAQFRSLALDEDRNRKKQLKRELNEKSKAESAKVAYVLDVQRTLRSLPPSWKEDLTSGTEGAPELTQVQVGALEEFSSLVDLDGGEKKLAEHYMNLVDGKPRKVGGTTYADLKNVFASIKSSGYLDKTKDLQSQEEEETEEEEVAASEELSTDPEVAASGEVPTRPLNGTIDNGNDDTLCQDNCEEPSKDVLEEPKPEEQPPQIVYSSRNLQEPPHQDPREVITAGGGFNFLQESQIDPINMDPAVVVVQHSPPHAVFTQGPQAAGIPTPTFTNQMYIAPTTLAAIPQQVAFHQTAAPFHQAMQQHVHHQQHAQQKQPSDPQLSHPQAQFQPHQPGTNEQPHQHLSQETAPPFVPNEVCEEEEQRPVISESQQEPLVRPQGYAAAAAGVKASVKGEDKLPGRTPALDSQQHPTIEDWSGDWESEDKDNGSFRGRGRGRGSYRGSRKDNGYRGRGGRGNVRGGRGGANGNPNGGGNYFRGEREFRGRGSRGGRGVPYRGSDRSNGYNRE